MALSDYGRGYITCLFQYGNHQKRLDEYLTLGIGRELNYIELWANGASDHLYGLIKPRRIPTGEWNRARKVMVEALDWGHGFKNSKVTEAMARESIHEARALCRLALDRVGAPYPDSVEEAVWIDQTYLKLKTADKGEYSCSEDVEAL